ncbi:MAG: acyl-CoA dehydrogenase [Methylococcales symbiont of Hymedesmia sp. n. MRB-2018]|nr:MAG: acyl-CoA dehydrogenase [Methylococcales symbiont of Hymedesmia sp. n. MRB-2018]KAF3984280.1 MAG: acyl-CoA dehydrogenase [Methylococcales symbiont of Hymedesmia sp. n. MRB-2018]
MIWLALFIITFVVLVYQQIALLKSTLVLAAILIAYNIQNFHPVLLGSYLFIAIVVNVPVIRQQLISKAAYKWMRSALPEISQTEQEALDAGGTWWDAELFSGRPNWDVLLNLPAAQLTEEEQAFIDGPVETLCAMLDDWEITHKLQDLPESVWDYIKDNKFCGMIIPKKYDGLDFSHFAHSEIVMKISSRCSSAAVTVMVPNSLGPAKLLLACGTQQQKEYYLPRLAKGQEIPCFALTGPNAGSDAGAIPDTGIVCYGTHKDKKKVLGIRLNWEKRYITLAPVATVIALAFKLYDPEHLIGDKENIGITVALIPANTKGVSIGNRHFPLNAAFQNGPNWGKDVFIPIDWILGGLDQVGNGWKMLMQSLATGRSISLPALSAGASKFTCRNTGAYSRIRKQFNLSIGEFEGIEEPLARMAGETYIINAARVVTASALDQGHKPSVISAIIKYELTERMRRVVTDGMDIQGGSGICLGPKNYLGRLYQVIPVCITVEGANILTRTMMIFGQGAVRCHPLIYQEMKTLYMKDKNKALVLFDELIFKHIGFIMGNKVSSFWLAISYAKFVKTPGNEQTKTYYQAIARLSAGFAFLSDYAIIVLGGSLKRKERISGRFADAISNLYLCSAVLKQFEDQGCPEDDLPLMHWATQQTIFLAQQALLEITRILPFSAVAWCVNKMIIFPLGKPYCSPSDKLTHQIASILLNDTEARDRLTQGIYINEIEDDATGRIECAFKAVLAAIPVEKKIRLAQKNKVLPKGYDESVLKLAVDNKIINVEERTLIEEAERMRSLAIEVDDFSGEALAKPQIIESPEFTKKLPL